MIVNNVRGTKMMSQYNRLLAFFWPFLSVQTVSKTISLARYTKQHVHVWCYFPFISEVRWKECVLGGT